MSSLKKSFENIKEYYKHIIDISELHKKETALTDKKLNKKIKIINETAKEIIEYIEKRSEFKNGN